MINITNEKNCCGCAACKAVCPKKCIEMKTATLGAVVPVVDPDMCIDCKMCEKVCPMLNDTSDNQSSQKDTYAAYSKDASIRYRGSSGGIFGTFAHRIVEDNYIIYGAAFDADLKLKCTCADSEEKIAPLTKSKYLQSDLSEKYSEIKEKLENGKKIMFVSTPCQVAALKRYLNRDYDNLITVDFFCHGVPSQDFFDKCRDNYEKKKNVKIIGFEFRSKIKHGRTPHYYTLTYLNMTKIENETRLYFDFPFYAAFQKYINLRESCYECRFSSKRRYLDITIGDFHDIDNYVKDINRFEGVSTVIINTEKGKGLWEMCKDMVVSYPIDLQQLIDDKVCFQGGTKRPSGRDDFICAYNNLPFDAFVEIFLNSRAYRKQRLYYSMPKSLRKIIKKLMKV